MGQEAGENAEYQGQGHRGRESTKTQRRRGCEQPGRERKNKKEWKKGKKSKNAQGQPQPGRGRAKQKDKTAKRKGKAHQKGPGGWPA